MICLRFSAFLLEIRIVGSCYPRSVSLVTKIFSRTPRYLKIYLQYMCRYMHIVSYSQGFLRFVRCCRHHRSLVCWTGLGCCRRCPRPICVKCKFKSYWKRGLCDSSRRHMKKRDVVGDLASPSPSWLFIHFAGFFFSALLVQLKMSLLLL